MQKLQRTCTESYLTRTLEARKGYLGVVFIANKQKAQFESVEFKGPYPYKSLPLVSLLDLILEPLDTRLLTKYSANEFQKVLGKAVVAGSVRIFKTISQTPHLMEAITFRRSSLKNLNGSDLNLLSRYYPPVLEPRAVLCLLGSLQRQPSGRELSVTCFAVSHLKVSFGPKQVTTAKKPG